MKEKILAAIKSKFPAVNLSKARLDAIAAKIEAKVVDDESKIDAELDAYNDYNPLAETAKADDKVRGLEAKLKAPKPADPANPKADDPKPEGVPDDAPAWVKQLIAQNDKLANDLAAIKGEKAADSIKGKATTLLKDVPVSYWGKRALPEKEEDLEAFVTDVTADYTAFKQEMTDAGLSVLSAPKTGGGSGEAKAISPEIKAFAEKQNAAAAPAAAK